MGLFLTICATAMILGFLLLFVLAILGGTFCRKSIGHGLFGWHDCDVVDPTAPVKTGFCKYCGKKCEMDYEGEWRLA